ncbi:MAG TPA: pitrilysin family protein, partial [Bacteroidia bacterium]|nr:pitrilysin family protein [Bacteroidia bacterium]
AQVVSTKAKLVETVTTNGPGKLCIPYSKYVLPNGLTLIISEDHSDPIVHTEVMYHVGSARETEGRSGFAHFFEHMMFQGSGHVADEEHFKLVTEAGGDLNGNTTTDRTTYFETLPSNNLELALWLESDRMGFLLDSVTQKKFEIQRSTVKNERGQNYDNAPYGLVWEKIGQAMYPEGHPYSWQTIGYIADLDAANVTDLRNFFMRWYGPNNATLLITGDVKTADVVTMVEKYFGSFKRGPEVKPMAKMPVSLTKDRVISYEDNIRFPQLTIARPGVCTMDPDEAPLDALCDIISNGKNSVFYKTFVESKVAQSATMYDATEELTGFLAINIKTFPGHTPHEADSLINVALAEFEKRGVTDDDLTRYKLYIEGVQMDQLTTVAGKSGSLAVYQTFFGNPNMIQKDLDRYQAITKEDVMRVYNKYIKNKPAVVLTVYPKGKPELKARPDDYTIPPYKAGTSESAEYKNLVYNRPVDNFDRSKQPIPGPTPAVNVPSLWKTAYPNGLQVIGTQSTEIPRTY